MAGRESRGMGGVRGDPSGGFLQAPTVRLCWNGEVTTAGVGICAAGHPWNRQRLQHSRESAAGYFLAGNIRGTKGGSTGARGHPPASETGGTGPSRTNTDGP